MGFFGSSTTPEERWKARFFDEVKKWGVDESRIVYRHVPEGNIIGIPFRTKKGREYMIQFVVAVDGTNYIYIEKPSKSTPETLARANMLNNKYVNLTFTMVGDLLVIRSTVLYNLEEISIVTFMRDMARIAVKEFAAF